MVIHARCHACGLIFPSRFFKGAGVGTRNAESCIRCGAIAEVEDFANGRVMGVPFLVQAAEAFRQASRHDLVQFQTVVREAAAGTISAGAAEAQSHDIAPTFAKLIVFALQLGIPGLLVAIIALYIQLQANHSSDIGQHELLQALNRQAQADQQIASELHRLHVGECSATARPPTPPKIQGSTGQLNRHARRKAAREVKKGD